MELKWSGFHLDFNTQSVEKYAPPKGGIYLLWVKRKNRNGAKWQTLYAGKADNLKETLLAHLTNGDNNPFLKKQIQGQPCGFEFATVERERDRGGIQKYLYDFFGGPEGNQGDPGGEPIRVDVP